MNYNIFKTLQRGNQKICKFREKMQSEYDEVCKIVTYGTPVIECEDFIESIGLEIPQFLNK